MVPTACQATHEETVKEGDFSYVVVQNSATEPLSLALPNGRGAELRPQSWFTYRVRRGDSIEVPGRTCLVGLEQPTLTVIQPKP